MRLRHLAPFLAILLTSCVTKEERTEQKGSAMRIDRLLPDKVMAGADFNVQANKQSALSIVGEHLGPGSRIKMNGEPLETTVSPDGKSLAALVAPRFYAKEGTFAVSVDLPDGRASNTLPFVVLPTTGPAPSIIQLFPDSTTAGKSFNVQANGTSAMGMTGSNFLPSAKILLNGEPLETSFGDIDKLGVTVPPKFFAKQGIVKVTVRNPDGKVSAPVDFPVK